MTLKSALHELCAEFGKVTSIDILTMSEAQELRLMSSLGISRFGSEVLVVVDLPS